ncbi:MAG: AAA family ATPase [Bacteroidia bacterium]|nr:AAA family ATPase [Bacteroidia bacterium]
MRDRVVQGLEARMTFEPTTSQREALFHIADFLLSTEANNALVINGYAGTGKTSILKALCDIAAEGGYKLVLMAPTGRAAKVLSNATGRPAMTIHRTIYRQESNAFDAHFGLGFNAFQHTLFIVDEASMIGDNYSGETEFGSGRLLTDLVGYVFSHEASRLLLVGDPAQLPPIGADRSPALDEDVLRNLGLNVDSVWLTDVVRQEQDSLILNNALRIREIIESGDPILPQYPRLAEDKKLDVERVSGAELIETLASAYDYYGTENVLVVTRSNKRAARFNQGIRGQVLMSDEEISRGDMLLVAKNNYMWLSRMAAADSPNEPLKYKKGDDFIANGDIAQVVRVRGYKEMYGLKFADVLLRFADHEGVDIDLRILMNCLTSELPKLTTDDERQLFSLVEEDYADIRDQRKRYNAIRNDEWFNALQVKFAYAVTCHKAQGGQWDCVFIDMGYVPEETVDKSFLQWLYTALTRATQKVYLVNFPDEMFGE